MAASRVTRFFLHVSQPGGAVGKQRRGLDAGRHLGELRLGHLEIGERLPEHLSFPRPRERFVQGTPREAERSARHARPKDIERLHGELEAFAFLAEEVFRGHTAAGKTQRRHRMRGDDVDALPDREPGRVGVDDER